MPEIQLVVTAPSGQVRVYPVAKDLLIIGRSSANDIVLYDQDVSRQHARLHRLPDGFEIEDLGSTNGTWLKGEAIKRAPLTIGQPVQIANSTLHLQQAVSQPTEEPNPQTLDELTSTLASSTMKVELPDLSQPRLVIHAPWRTWEVTLTEETTTIGRQSNCQVFLHDKSVSRQHARINREQDAFVLVDLGSHNGTLLNGRRIEKQTLRHGDAFQIGSVTCVYNAPLGADAQTPPLRPLASARSTRRPVVFIPGFMGSELWRGSERIWPNVKTMFTNPEIYRVPSKEPIEARQLVSEIVILPKFVKLERYAALGDFLCEDLGYERGKDLLEFPWDWRLDPRVVAQDLAAKIAHWREQVAEAREPITLIAHSLGCLVARYYVEKLDGKAVASRLILLGGTHSGMPKTLQVFSAFGRQSFIYGIAEPFQRALASAPSVYTVLPSYPSVFDSDGRPLDLYRDESWCPELYRPLLRDARAFHRELGTGCSVPTISIFGYGMPTLTRATLETRHPAGGWEQIRFETAEQGDDTVPEVSARLLNAEIHPVHQHHGMLYADNDVRVRLRLELTR